MQATTPKSKKSNKVTDIATSKSEKQTKHQEHHTNANTKIKTMTKMNDTNFYRKKGENRSIAEKNTKTLTKILEHCKNNNTLTLLRLFSPSNFVLVFGATLFQFQFCFFFNFSFVTSVSYSLFSLLVDCFIKQHS